MRKLYAILIAVGLALAVGSQASAVSITLSQAGGTYAGEGTVPSPSDTLILDINVTLDAGDAVTGVFAAFDLNNCGGCSFTGGTEEAFSFVGGVLLTPIGAPGADIGPGVAAGTIKGWEAQTLTVTGAPGPASFTLGTASFHLNGAGTIQIGGASVPTGDTIIGGANFVDITAMSTLGNFVVPEPTTFAMLGLGLAGLAWAGRRES